MGRSIRLVIFDLDGTLTPVDSLWRYLHDAFGTWDQGRAAAERYKRGEISYQEWAETDARYWAGAQLTDVVRIIDRIPYREGTTEVFEALRKKAVRTAILSAGLSLLADKAARDLGADLALSNELRTNDGRLTGEIDVKVAVNNKKEIAEQIARKLRVQMDEVALVGDRAADLSHPQCLRIAFQPKDEVARRQAHFVVESEELTGILQYLI